MADFDEAIEIVLDHEGGYVNDPKDPGGETKFGISKRSYPSIDVKKLTIDKAKNIYKKYYWVTIKGDDINPQCIANKLLDLSVNMGCKPAIKCIQNALCNLDHETDVDGVMGSCTLNFINICNADDLLDEFKDEAAAHYKKINNSKYIKGWLNRVYS